MLEGDAGDGTIRLPEACGRGVARCRRADPDRLTDRETDVLRLVVAGMRNKEIAADLGISENTAKFHLRNIQDKLHAQNRAEVVARPMRDGLVDRGKGATEGSLLAGR